MYIVNPRETAKNIFKRGMNNKSIGKIKWNNKKNSQWTQEITGKGKKETKDRQNKWAHLDYRDRLVKSKRIKNNMPCKH